MGRERAEVVDGAGMVRLMGMDAGRKPDVLVRLGDRLRAARGGQVGSDRDDPLDPVLLGPRDHRFEVALEGAIVQVGVGIDEHGGHSTLRQEEDQRSGGYCFSRGSVMTPTLIVWPAMTLATYRSHWMKVLLSAPMGWSLAK